MPTFYNLTGKEVVNFRGFFVGIPKGDNTKAQSYLMSRRSGADFIPIRKSKGMAESFLTRTFVGDSVVVLTNGRIAIPRPEEDIKVAFVANTDGEMAVAVSGATLVVSMEGKYWGLGLEGPEEASQLDEDCTIITKDTYTDVLSEAGLPMPSAVGAVGILMDGYGVVSAVTNEYGGKVVTVSNGEFIDSAFSGSSPRLWKWDTMNADKRVEVAKALMGVSHYEEEQKEEIFEVAKDMTMTQNDLKDVIQRIKEANEANRRANLEKIAGESKKGAKEKMSKTEKVKKDKKSEKSDKNRLDFMEALAELQHKS